MKLREHSVKINGLFRPVIDTVPKFSWKLIADKNGKARAPIGLWYLPLPILQSRLGHRLCSLS